jgi:hypothetical protein
LGFPVPVPKAATPVRSNRITAAAVVLLLTAALAAIGFLIVLATKGSNAGGAEGRLTRGAALVYLSLAAINLVAGVLVLRLRPNGRTIGLIVGSIGIVIGLVSLVSSGWGLVTIALDGFVVWVLATEADAFRPGT